MLHGDNIIIDSKIVYQKLHNLHFAVSVWWIIFQPTAAFSQTLFYRYFYGKWSKEP